MILIGSSAIKYWFPDFPREPKDIDYIVDIPRDNTEGIEYLLNPILDNYKGGKVLGVNGLYTLKISHLFWNLNWEKHMFDVQFLRKKGAKLDLELFHRLYNYWCGLHGKNKRSDLKMSSEDFFDNAIDSEYEHDDIHTLLKPIPTYSKILKDNAEVEVDEYKFNLLSHEEKCNLAAEEVMVMAWERYKDMNYMKAYSVMLKKFIISHAPIWEAIFIIENYIELHKPKFNYFKTINDGLQNLNRRIKEPRNTKKPVPSL